MQTIPSDFQDIELPLTAKGVAFVELLPRQILQKSYHIMQSGFAESEIVARFDSALDAADARGYSAASDKACSRVPDGPSI